MLTKKQQKNARQLQSMVIYKLNYFLEKSPTHHLTTLFDVDNLSYDDLGEIYHYINAVVMFNTIPVHEHLTAKAKQVLFNAGVYATLDDDKLITYYFVNKSLNMSTGKIAIQTARVGQLMLLGELQNDDTLLLDSLNELYDHSKMHGNKTICLAANQNQMNSILNGDIAEQIEQLSKESNCPIRTYPIYDRSVTETPKSNLTVIGLTPVPQSIITPIVKKFQLL